VIIKILSPGSLVECQKVGKWVPRSLSKTPANKGKSDLVLMGISNGLGGACVTEVEAGHMAIFHAPIGVVPTLLSSAAVG